MLGPGESEGFRLALVGDEGHIYTCSLVATCKNVKTEAEARATSREFTVEFPIRSIELLRARKKKAGDI